MDVGKRTEVDSKTKWPMDGLICSEGKLHWVTKKATCNRHANQVVLDKLLPPAMPRHARSGVKSQR